MSSLVPTMPFGKIAAALPATLGKTIAGAFLAEYSGRRWRVILAFTDGTHYELYGDGAIEGLRALEEGGVDEVRVALMDAAAERVIEISPGVAMPARSRGRIV